MQSRTRPAHTRETYTKSVDRVKRFQRFLDTLIVVAAVFAATGAIVIGGIIADSIPGWYWPIICAAILAVGVCVLARGDS